MDQYHGLSIGVCSSWESPASSPLSVRRAEGRCSHGVLWINPIDYLIWDGRGGFAKNSVLTRTQVYICCIRRRVLKYILCCIRIHIQYIEIHVHDVYTRIQRTWRILRVQDVYMAFLTVYKTHSQTWTYTCKHCIHCVPCWHIVSLRLPFCFMHALFSFRGHWCLKDVNNTLICSIFLQRAISKGRVDELVPRAMR